MKRRFYLKTAAAVLAAAMVLGSAVSVYAEDGTTQITYPVPTSSMAVDEDIITVSVHRDTSVLPEVLGLNTKCGFGMINGFMPNTLSEAQTKLMLNAFGSSYNKNPDPYYYNYYYNFYAAENGLPLSSDAVMIPITNMIIIPTVPDPDTICEYGINPVVADTITIYEYGTPISLAGRPDILIGTASSWVGTDTDGYNALIAEIRSQNIGSVYYQTGDENYQPYLVSYTTATTYDMVKTLNEAAKVAESISASDPRNTDADPTNDVKMWRYEDPTDIAEAFGDYVCGVSTYILSELEENNMAKKKVAVVQKINSDGTFTLANGASQDATSSVRGTEYIALVADNIAANRANLTVSTSVLLTADVIILSASNGGGNDDLALPNTLAGLKQALGENADTLLANKEVIAANPDTMHGITRNSIENGMGFGYFGGRIYDDTAVDINPVELCAYFYEKFYHVKASKLQDLVNMTFADVIENNEQGVSLSLAGYSASKIEAMLAQGKAYYYTHISQFSNTALTKVWGTRPGDGIEDGVSNIYDTANDVASIIVNSCSDFSDNGAAVSLSIASQPAGCSYALSSVQYKAEGADAYTALTLGTDYTISGNNLTINHTDNTGPGTYKVIYADSTGGHANASIIFTVASADEE